MLSRRQLQALGSVSPHDQSKFEKEPSSNGSNYNRKPTNDKKSPNTPRTLRRKRGAALQSADWPQAYGR